MADLTPIPMGIPWDPWDPSLPHSHAHLYTTPIKSPFPIQFNSATLYTSFRLPFPSAFLPTFSSPFLTLKSIRYIPCSVHLFRSFPLPLGLHFPPFFLFRQPSLTSFFPSRLLLFPPFAIFSFFGRVSTTCCR